MPIFIILNMLMTSVYASAVHGDNYMQIVITILTREKRATPNKKKHLILQPPLWNWDPHTAVEQSSLAKWTQEDINSRLFFFSLPDSPLYMELLPEKQTRGKLPVNCGAHSEGCPGINWLARNGFLFCGSVFQYKDYRGWWSGIDLMGENLGNDASELKLSCGKWLSIG